MFRLNPETLGNRPIILAVSGGPDSMAMAGHAIDWHNQHLDTPLKAVIVDHGIRDGSAEEAKLVQSWLEGMGLHAKILKLQEKAPQKGIQAWAREGRYRVLAEEARKDAAVVVTAHHADDQAETVAMRLTAGSGLGGLSAMKPETRYGDMTILRPFLEMTKDALHQILHLKHIPYVSDPSNENEHFERIAWRSRWSALAEDGLTTDTFLKLKTALSILHDKLMMSIKRAMDGRWGRVPCGAIWLESNAVFELPDDAAIALLRTLSMKLGQSQNPIRHQSAKTVLAALKTRQDNGIATTLAGLEWYCRGDLIWIYREAERDVPMVSLKDGVMLYDDIWQMRSPYDVKIMPMGAERAAQLRKIAPDDMAVLITAHAGSASAADERKKDRLAPMRALWRLPVVMPITPHLMPNTTQTAKSQTKFDNLSGSDGMIALEDGTILPHLIKELDFSHLPNMVTMADCRVNDLF